VLTAVVAAIAVSAGGAMAFSTPAVLTGKATGVTQTSATLNGSVNPEGSATTYQFQWGPTAAYGNVTPGRQAGHGTKAISVSITLGSLLPGTIYHCRLIATNAAGQSLGADRTFVTAGHPPPTPATGGPSALGETFATVTGVVNTQGATTSWWFQYGLTPAYGSSTYGGIAAAAAAPVAIAETIRGLAPGTIFHYRLLAAHGGFVNYGADQTLITFPVVRPKPRLRAGTNPHRARKAPYLFVTDGSVLTGPIPPSVGCNGTVAVRYFIAHRSVAVRYTRLQPNCTFTRAILFHGLIGHHRRQLRVEVRFWGNSYLASAGARPQRVMLG
jgi:hypothetical protein